METKFNVSGHGRPIVFLPGLFAGGWIWEPVVETVRARGYQAVVFDEAIPLAFSCRYKAAEEALIHVIERCSSAPVIVGNSMGALIGLEFSRRHPDKVSGLVMSGSPGLSEIEVGVSLHELKTGKREHAEMLVKRVFHDHSLVPDRGIEEVSQLFSNSLVFANITKWLLFSRSYDVSKAFEDIRCKPKLIWGRYDLITPLHDWVALSEKTEHVELNVIDDSGHSPMLETPRMFSEFLVRAIAEDCAVSCSRQRLYSVLGGA